MAFVVSSWPHATDGCPPIIMVDFEITKSLKGCCGVPKLEPNGMEGIMSPSTINAGFTLVCGSLLLFPLPSWL